MTHASRNQRRGTPAASPWLRLTPFLLAFAAVGCATIGGDPGQPLVPSRLQTRVGPFAVYAQTPVTVDSPVGRALRSLEHDVAADLGLRASADEPPVDVYILRDRDAFSHFLTFYYPELPPRRAFFLAQGPKRVVYTFYNDRLEEDLRHEATHALLHATVGDLPLWLDEGLAEYFEVPEGRGGVNAEHVGRLPDDLKKGWKPDLARLESLKSVQDMSPRDYRESWAWVHYLLNEPKSGRPALLAYLANLHASPDGAEPLSACLNRLDRSAGNTMLSHFEEIRANPTAAATRPVPKGPTVLLQNSPVDGAVKPALLPANPPAPRRSLLQRALGAFGLSGRG